MTLGEVVQACKAGAINVAILVPDGEQQRFMLGLLGHNNQNKHWMRIGDSSLWVLSARQGMRVFAGVDFDLVVDDYRAEWAPRTRWPMMREATLRTIARRGRVVPLDNYEVSS